MAVLRWMKKGAEVSHCCHHPELGKQPSVGGHDVVIPVAWGKIGDQALFDAGWFTDGRHWICPQHAVELRKEHPDLFDATWRQEARG